MSQQPLLLCGQNIQCSKPTISSGHRYPTTVSAPLDVSKTCIIIKCIKAGSQYDAEPHVALRHDTLRNCEHCAMVKRVAEIDLGSIRASWRAFNTTQRRALHILWTHLYCMAWMSSIWQICWFFYFSLTIVDYNLVDWSWSSALGIGRIYMCNLVVLSCIHQYFVLYGTCSLVLKVNTSFTHTHILCTKLYKVKIFPRYNAMQCLPIYLPTVMPIIIIFPPCNDYMCTLCRTGTGFAACKTPCLARHTPSLSPSFWKTPRRPTNPGRNLTEERRCSHPVWTYWRWLQIRSWSRFPVLQDWREGVWRGPPASDSANQDPKWRAEWSRLQWVKHDLLNNHVLV